MAPQLARVLPKDMAVAKLEELVEFAENPEPRCPCVLLLDTSGSMAGDKITQLYDGVTALKEALVKDDLASQRVEIAVVTFSTDVEVRHDFSSPKDLELAPFEAGGLTAMGSAVCRALDLVNERKRVYREAGIMYYRPWVFLVTDGAPQGERAGVFEEAARQVRSQEERNGVAFFAVGVDRANLQPLGELCVRQPLKLRGLQFHEMFMWLSSSLEGVSRSQVEETQVKLPPPGWAEV